MLTNNVGKQYVYCDMENDKLRVEKEWFEDGKLKSITSYKGDLLHGEYKEWYRNRQLRILENFKDGEKHGLSKGWYHNGQVAFEAYFKDGEVVNPIENKFASNIQEKQETKKTTCRFQDKFKPSSLASKVKELGIDVSKLLKKSSAQSKTIKNSNKLNKL